ncbi:E-selectin isoform X2 [Micropterus salmoides]|uniref:E-selectin isoform X2 n=1 Tax=Micropterus salmoides TaxID=27706 RepID=UPI0018EB8079|nr:E-selectin isoform X2 [Micropterus salmoides]
MFCFGLLDTLVSKTSTSWIRLTFLCSMLCMWTSVECWSYFYSNTTMPWDEARAWCQEHHTDMVAIQNQEEIKYLNTWLPQKVGYYWIGIRKINNIWTWVGTNKSLTAEATNWARGEPNNGKNGLTKGMSEDCVEMYIKRLKQSGKWNDERCLKLKTALCYTAACRNDSCHFGDCVETINSHKCVCFEGFSGEKCEKIVKCNKEKVTPPYKGSVNCTHKYEDFSYDSLCQYSCEEGYQLNRKKPLTCTASGKWSEQPPACELVRCQELTPPTRGSMNCSDPLGPSSYQSTCVFTCDEGYVLKGSPSNTLQCEASRNWNSSQPDCVAVQCPALQKLGNGIVSCGDDADMSFSYGSTCSFSCAPGYHLVGPSKVTCTSAAEWSEKMPHCEAITCQNPEGEDHLITNCSQRLNDLRPDSTCSFSCAPGYHLVGPSRVTCTSAAEWSEKMPHCEAITCQNPEGEDHLITNCSQRLNDLRPDSTCSFSCAPGYHLVGVHTILCSKDGQWTSTPPTCTVVRCQELTPPTRGSMNCSDPLGPSSYQSTCVFTCDEGYVLKGSPSNTLQCEASRNWNSSQPDCVAVQCPALQKLGNGIVSCGDDADMSFSYGSTCSFSCAPGYHLVGPSKVTCTSAAEWSEKMPHCEAITCQNPEGEDHLITNCSQRLNDLRPDSTCSFSCAPGYHLVGPSRVTCTSAAEWSEKMPHCEAITCQNPEGEDHLITSCSQRLNDLRPDSTCSFSCAPGYHLVGPSRVTCTSAAEWSEKMPHCEAITCQNPEGEDHLITNCSQRLNDLRPDSTCSFSCAPGYHLVGVHTILCSKDGQWTSTPPTCTVVRCQELTPPTRGSMNCSDPLGPSSYQSTCVFTCDEGYVLKGSPSNTLQCEASRNWNSSQPDCVAVQCPALQKLGNGIVSCGDDADMSFSYGSTCSFSCAPGYHLVGPSKVTCTSAAEWSEKMPHCEAITCQNPEGEDHLITNCSQRLNDLRPDSTCSFSCAPGYHLVGVHTILCSKDGQWTSTPPTCTVRCPLLEAPENGHVNCSSNEPVYNSQCSFTCNQDYSIDGHDLLTCDRHGNWTGEKPTCQAPPSPVIAIASSVATGGTVLSGLSVAMWILKRLKQKATKFELSSNSDIEVPPQVYKNSIDSLI